MKTYKLEVFDSRNTCASRHIDFAKDSLASEYAKWLSLSNPFKVSISNDIGFEDYENGELTSWTYPNGMGQIKLNS